jgi:hypothetical protein
MLNNTILSKDSIYNELEIEQLVNHFGGLLQILIVRIGQQNLSESMITDIFNYLSKICNWDFARTGAQFILNGLLNTLNSSQINQLSDTIISVIDSTIKGE